jgi:hypothetical protein
VFLGEVTTKRPALVIKGPPVLALFAPKQVSNTEKAVLVSTYRAAIFSASCSGSYTVRPARSYRITFFSSAHISWKTFSGAFSTMATLFTAIMALHSSMLLGKGFLQQLGDNLICSWKSANVAESKTSRALHNRIVRCARAMSTCSRRGKRER